MIEFPDFSEEIPTGVITFEAEDVPLNLPDEAKLTQWLASVAEAENKPLLEVTYIFCSDEYLLGINQEYLQHDFYTDIITFPLSEGAVHGDIFISTERVADNAQEMSVPYERELCRVLVHGVLHLAGYLDETDEQEAEMRAKEDFYLGKLTL